MVEGHAFLAGCDARLHIIDLDKGEAVGTVEIDAPTGSTPAAAGDRVYFGTEGGAFFSINWKDAEVDWSYEDMSRGSAYQSSAAVTDERVVVGGQGRR